MMNITGYLSKKSSNISCMLFELGASSLFPRLHINGKSAKNPIFQFVVRIERLARNLFADLTKLMFWLRHVKAKAIMFSEIPFQIQGVIHQNLSECDFCNLSQVSHLVKADIVSAKRQTCHEFATLMRDCLIQEPKLVAIFPHLITTSMLEDDFVEKDLFRLSQLTQNLHQALRSVASYWAYFHPQILKKIVEKLGYLPAEHPDCDRRFEEVDTRWPYGPLIPQLLDRAITSSCVSSLKILLPFVPIPKRRGRDGNLSSSLAAGSPQATGGRTDLNMAIMCSLRRDLYSRAEKNRFSAFYGAKAADQLEKISPAFNSAWSAQLQSEANDEEIWQLMRCSEKRAEITKTSQILHTTMERDVEICYSTPPFYHPCFDQIGAQQRRHIPFVLRDRHLDDQRAIDLKKAAMEHQSLLQRIEPRFQKAKRQPLEGDLSMTRIQIENRTFATFVEMTLFKTRDEMNRAHYYRSCNSLFEALHLSLFGYTHHAIALREAIKSFLYKTDDADFPHSKLEVLFNPPQPPCSKQLQNFGGHFFPDSLIYQWLLTAGVAKLFSRRFYLCSEVSCDKNHLPSVYEIDHFIGFAVGELRKYNLKDLDIEHQYQMPKTGGQLFISASFSPKTTIEPVHSLIAKQSGSEVERYFVPVRDDGPKTRFSPPPSP